MKMNKKINILLNLTAALCVWVVFGTCGLAAMNGLGRSAHDDYDSSGFWANDSGTSYFTPATKMTEGKYCQVWVENTQLEQKFVDHAQCLELASEYDNYIYPILYETFGSMKLDFPRNNGKVILYLLEIRTMSVAGYFYSRDFGVQPDSNHAAILYLDVTNNGGNVNMPSFFAVVAHEGQHLINYSHTVAAGRGAPDLWINEGLSSAAEAVYGGSRGFASGIDPCNRVDFFNGDQYQTIRNGNNFYVWNGYWENAANFETFPDGPKDKLSHVTSKVDIISNYSTAYLFFQWLRIQSRTGEKIFKEIISPGGSVGSYQSDYRAVLQAAHARIYDARDFTWSQLLRTWMLANALNEPNGLYGYNNEPHFRTINLHYANDGESFSRDLSPGEGVWCKIGSN
jgi:hypothetical protein